jgi:hypothetical protein
VKRVVEETVSPRAGGVDQRVEHLPSMLKALSSTPVPPIKQKTNKKWQKLPRFDKA